MNGNHWRSLPRTSRNATTYVGVVIIAMMWSGITFNHHAERSDAIATARENGRNLARAYEESVFRSISEIDKTLLLLRSRLDQNPGQFDLHDVAIDPIYSSDLAGAVSLIGADGFMSVSSTASTAERIDERDRDVYRVFRDSWTDRLYIGKPVVGRVSGKWIVVFARPVYTESGSFNGVLAITVDPAVLTNFFKIVDIGNEGRITLFGEDKVIRAAAGGSNVLLGQSFASQLWDLYPKSQDGFYYGQGFDGVRRLASFRKVRGLPLIASVAFSENEFLSGALGKQKIDDVIAGGITLLIVLGIGFNARHRARLIAAAQRIRASEARALEKSRELEITLEHMGQGLMMVDGGSKVAVINHHAIELLGLPDDFLGGQKMFADVMSCLWQQGEFGADGEILEPKVREFVKAGALDDIGTYERTRPNGTVLQVCSLPLPGGGMVRTFTDVTLRKHSEARIAHMARHDELTGLANRVLFRERIEQALARTRRLDESFGVILLDLDRFKDVNDTLGHPAGDALLKIAAQRLCQCVREIDTVARLGGDEFAIVQTATTGGRDNAQKLASRILKAIGEPYEILGRIVEIGTSIGIAVAPEHGLDAEELLKKADIALYTVKSEGRSHARFFEPAMEAKALARHDLEYDLRKALQGGEFEVLYQPMIDLASNEVCGAEALLRWNHPQRGTIAPGDFIPVAEEIGLISEIGAWVARTACADAMRWPNAIKVAVNLSPAQFKDNRLVDIVKNVLTSSGLPPGRLELEITETVILQDSQDNMSALTELRSLGVGIALDDFGTGYSSLSHLRSFPFTKIKIDKSFVMGDKPDCAAIVRAVADLGRSLNVPTIAEGVETPAQLELVRAAGCQEAQGFLFSRPIPAWDIANAIARCHRTLEHAA